MRSLMTNQLSSSRTNLNMKQKTKLGNESMFEKPLKALMKTKSRLNTLLHPWTAWSLKDCFCNELFIHKIIRQCFSNRFNIQPHSPSVHRFYTKVKEKHSYNTMSLETPRIRTNYGKFCSKCIKGNLWNSNNESLKNYKIATSKRKL